MSDVNKVLVNNEQSLSEAAKTQARTNIGAASAADLDTLSNTVANHSYAIAGLESRLGSAIAAATVPDATIAETLIGDLDAVKVYAAVTTASYCQLKVTANDTTIVADQSVIKSINGNFDGFRIYNQPWNIAGQNLYTANIVHAATNYGTIKIDILTSNSKIIHLTVWYWADTASGLYRFEIVEEVIA